MTVAPPAAVTSTGLVREMKEDRVSHVERIGLQRGETRADSQKLHLSIAELGGFYDVERQLTRAISRLPQDTSWSALRDAFETHLTETRREVSRLERVIEDLWEKVRNHRADVPPSAPETTVPIPVGSGASFGPTGMPHTREDYDADGDDTLVAWARAIGDEPTADLPAAGSDEIGAKPSTR